MCNNKYSIVDFAHSAAYFSLNISLIFSDLELPDASVRAAAEPVVTLHPEERLKFKEKTITSISRKKANVGDSSAPVEFKKRKSGARSLRSKDDSED